jgi:hypothetical protein
MINGYDLGFRFDLLGLSSEWADGIPTVMEDGTPVINGSTAYEVDTGKFYIYYKGQWYEQGAEVTSADDSKEVTEESNVKNIEEPIEVVEPIIQEPLEK